VGQTHPHGNPKTVPVTTGYTRGPLDFVKTLTTRKLPRKTSKSYGFNTLT